MTPCTFSLFWNAFSSLPQLSSRRALSRDSTASPSAFSIRSRNTSTSSPTLSSPLRPGPVNSRTATRPSVFRPTSMTAMSFSMATTVPLMTGPSWRLPWVNDSSSIEAKSSRDGAAAAAVTAMKSPGAARRRLKLKGVPNDQGRRSRRPPTTTGNTGRPARVAQQAGGWLVCGTPSLSRTERAWSSTTSAQSATPPARSGGLDNGDGGPERRVYIEMRGIEQVRIRRPHQRRDGPAGVALVAAQDVGEDVGFVNLWAAAAELEGAALGAHLRGGGDEDLHVRIRADHRADVAAVEHGAGRGGRKRALERRQGGPHPRNGGHQRGRLADGLALERRLVEGGRVERCRGFR